MGIVIKQSIKGTIVNYVGIAVGFVTTFFIVTKYLTQEEIGLTREQYLHGVFAAQLIRKRYTVLDFLYEAGLLKRAVSEVL